MKSELSSLGFLKVNDKNNMRINPSIDIRNKQNYFKEDEYKIMDLIIKDIKVFENKKACQLDFTPLLTLAFTNNKKLEKDINNIYQKNKDKADQLTKKSKFIKSCVIFNGNIEKDNNKRKALAVIELIKDTNDNITLEKLIKKGWKGIHELSKDESRDLTHLFNSSSLLKTNRQEMKNFKSSEDFKFTELNDEDKGLQAIVAFIAHFYSTNIFFTMFGKSITNGLALLSLESNEFIKLGYVENLVEEDKAFNKRIEYIGKHFLELTSNASNFEELYSFVENENVNKLINSINSLFDLEDLSFLNSIYDDNIHEEEIYALAGNYLLTHRNQNKDKAAEHIIYYLYLQKLIQAYKITKKEYFKLSDILNEMPSEREIEKQLSKLKDKHNETVIKNNNLEKQLEIVKFENERLRKDYKQTIEKENIKLHQQIQSLIKEKEEILANEVNLKDELKELEEFTNNLLEENDKDSAINNDIEESIISTIQGLNVLMLGGHKGWHSKLKEILGNNLSCVEGNNVNFDKNLIDNKDVVFIYTDFMSHGFFRKIIRRMKSQGVPYGFIESTSINRALEEMYEIIIGL